MSKHMKIRAGVAVCLTCGIETRVFLSNRLFLIIFFIISSKVQHKSLLWRFFETKNRLAFSKGKKA